jgi:kanamycin nucleotidyltransferase
MDRAWWIADRIHRHYAERVLALGIYGSLARNMDGPYSDIEIFCIIEGVDNEENLEWSQGTWKAEVNVLSPDVLMRMAGKLDVDWSLTHGAFVNVLRIYDPYCIFEKLRIPVYDHNKDEILRALKEIIVVEILELIGKIKNLRKSVDQSGIGLMVYELIERASFLLSMDAQRLYSLKILMLQESLEITKRPDGYDNLCRMVIEGNLSNPDRIFAAADRFWQGVESWAEARG